MSQFSSSKESTECLTKKKVYECIKTQLLEVKSILKIDTSISCEQKKLLEKFNSIIIAFEEFDKTLKEEKLQSIEK